MGFVESVTTCLKKSFDPSGRALRSEFWYFMLFMVLVNIVFTLTALFLGKPFVLLHMSLMPASVCVAVRRLHDIGYRWLALMVVGIPLIGYVILLQWMARPGEQGPNRFGPAPVPVDRGPPATIWDQ